ncbi:MAG TPA: transposase [Humisphaera sp.]|jgi:putative transposase|nr:transposase [Humisphaera sp.]
MPRKIRVAAGGVVYHVLNRAVGRADLFHKPSDYAAFEKILAQSNERLAVPVLAYCLMPNHWHLVLWPRKDGDLSKFMRWLTVTHAQRHHAHYKAVGTGPVYQGRFKSFPVQDDRHLLIVCRYVERNPLRANLVSRAEAWMWSSLHQRRMGHPSPFLLAEEDWPLQRPADWLQWVNRPQTAKEEAAVVQSIRRGRPFGEDAWQRQTARRLSLLASLNPTHRAPRKTKKS